MEQAALLRRHDLKRIHYIRVYATTLSGFGVALVLDCVVTLVVMCVGLVLGTGVVDGAGAVVMVREATEQLSCFTYRAEDLVGSGVSRPCLRTTVGLDLRRCPRSRMPSSFSFCVT